MEIFHSLASKVSDDLTEACYPAFMVCFCFEVVSSAHLSEDFIIYEEVALAFVLRGGRSALMWGRDVSLYAGCTEMIFRTHQSMQLVESAALRTLDPDMPAQQALWDRKAF